MVQVGAQVAVTAKPGTGIILQQQQHKHTQGVLLEKGACIGRATALVKTAFVADTDATCIPPPDMGTRQGQGTQGLDVTVLADIKNDNLRRRSPGAGGLSSSRAPYSSGRSGWRNNGRR